MALRNPKCVFRYVLGQKDVPWIDLKVAGASTRPGRFTWLAVTAAAALVPLLLGTAHLWACRRLIQQQRRSDILLVRGSFTDGPRPTQVRPNLYALPGR